MDGTYKTSEFDDKLDQGENSLNESSKGKVLNQQGNVNQAFDDISLHSMRSSEANTNEEDKIDFDEMYENKIGQFGYGQMLLIFCVCLPMSLAGPIAFFSQMFMTFEMDHWCKVPGLESYNLTTDEIKQFTIPKQGDSFSQCQMYDIDFKTYIEQSQSFIPSVNWTKVSCKNGWNYDRTIFNNSIVSEWDLVCDKKVIPTIANALGNLGVFFASFLIGYINDRFGRRKGFIVAVFILIISGMAVPYARDVYAFIATRTVFVSSMSLFFVVYTYAIEIVGSRFRGHVSIMITSCFGTSIMINALLSYLFKDWKNLSYALALPNLALIIPLWNLPESPRWLHLKNKLPELNSVLDKLSRWNRKGEFKEDLTKLRKIELTKQESLFALLKTPNLRKKALILTYMNFISIVLYLSLTLVSPALGSNPYIAVLLSGSIEIPANIVGYFMMSTLGRRFTSSFTFLAAGILTIAVMILKSIPKIGLTVLFLAAKFAITANYMPILPFSNELMPTSLRTSAVVAFSNVGLFATTGIPFIAAQGKHYMEIPLMCLGAASLLAGVLALMLPETLNQPLPETLEDAEMFGKDMKLKDYITCLPVKNKKKSDAEQ